MSLRKRALNGFFWSLLDKMVNQLGYLGATIYIARIIGPENFGLIGMLTIFMLLAESVVSGGFSQALIHRSQELTEEDSSTIFYINLIWGLLMYLLLYLAAPIISRFYDQPELVVLSRVLFLVVIINPLSVVARAKLTINIDFKSQTMVGAFSTALSTSVGIYLALAGYDSWALVWLLIVKAISNVFGFYFFNRWFPKLIFSFKSFKLIFGFGSKIMLAGIVATLVSNLYVALIGRYFNAIQVGYFTQATNLSNYLTQFISATLQGVTFPIMTSVKDDRERLSDIYTQLISITMFVSLPLLIGFAAISEDFILLVLGEEWLSSASILTALCLARAITPISAINMNVLNAVGRSDLYLKVDLSKLPMTLGALFIALPYGIEALAWSMVCTSFIAFFINSYYPGRLFGFGAIEQLKVGYKYIVATAIMFVAIHGISIEQSLLLTFTTKIFMGALIYVSVLVILRDSFFIQNIKPMLDMVKQKIKG